MSSENIPPAPYSSQVDNWQDDTQDDAQGDDVNSLSNTDDGGVSLSEGEYDNVEREPGTRSSKRSRKSSRKQPSRAESGSIIWTRAPPKKSYEPDPFLSIDNLPVEKKKQYIAQQQIDERSTLSRGPKVPYNSPAPAANVGSRVSSAHMSSRPSTCSGWNRLVPKHPKHLHPEVLQGATASHSVKAPFKHSLASRTIKEQESPRPDSPGLPMKEKTALATYHVARTIAKQKPASANVISGRLLKAKLKPISTVDVEGPSIHNCKGIVAGSRSKKDVLRSIDDADNDGRWAPFCYYKRVKESAAYALARSRTLQRRRHILQTVGTGPLRHGDRPGTSESIHQTSIASDEDVTGDRLDELNVELQQLEQTAEEALAAAAQAEDDKLDYPRVPTNSEVFITEEKNRDGPTSAENTRGSQEAATHEQNQEVKEEPPITMETKMAADGASRVSSGKSKPGSAKSGGGEQGSRPQTRGSRPPTEGSQRKVRFSASSSASKARSAAVELDDDPDSGDQTLALVRREYGQGDYADENANNSNNTGRTEPLRMSINDMTLGFECPEETRSVRGPQKIRPTSAHKTWGESQKPDHNISDLAISGKSAGNDDEDTHEEVKVTRKTSAKSRYRVNSAAARVYNRGSPRGNRPVGPREFMEQEKDRARPVSAMVLYDPMEVDHQPKPLEPRPHTPNVGLGGKRRVLSSAKTRQRPSSSTRRNKKPPGNTAVRSQTRCSSAHTYDPRVPVHVQCCVCVKKLKKYLTEEEAKNPDKIMCKECQTFRGIMAEYNAIAAPKNLEKEKEEEDTTLAIEYNVINEDELGIVEDVVDSDEEVQGYELLTNMDDIERSLAEIRGQIKESQARFTEKQEEEKRVRFEDSGDVFLTEASKLVECVMNEAIREETPRDEVTGEMSSLLLDCTELPPTLPAVKPLLKHMKVYHLKEEDEEITTFPMTVMQEEEEGTGFLQMLMQELPEETRQAPQRPSSPALEVTAQPARMTAAREVSMPDSIAPFSPLCFKINARPPAGYLYYFAYGIDMNPNRFSTYIGRQHAERSWGLMMGFRLKFNRIAEDAGCFPNVEPHACSSVEGCLYLITPTELHHLYKHMGGAQALQQVMLPVWLLNCDSPSELGVMQYCVPALLLVAMDTALHTAPDSVDSSYAVDQCIKGGGDVLSPAYIEQLQDTKQHAHGNGDTNH